MTNATLQLHSVAGIEIDDDPRFLGDSVAYVRYVTIRFLDNTKMRVLLFGKDVDHLNVRMQSRDGSYWDPKKN